MDITTIFRVLLELVVKFFKWLWRSFIWLFLLMFALDILSKQLIKNLLNVGANISLIDGFLSINYVQNNGMAFGIEFGNDVANTVFFIAISIIGFLLIAGFMIYYYRKKKLYGVGLAAASLMLSGTFGNLIDRSFYVSTNAATGETYHYVVDFIGFDFGSYSFPRFNVADSCLVIGTIMLIIWLIVEDIKMNKVKKKVDEAVQLTNDLSNDSSGDAIIKDETNTDSSVIDDANKTKNE